jgi:hypothetical protein
MQDCRRNYRELKRPYLASQKAREHPSPVVLLHAINPCPDDVEVGR